MAKTAEELLEEQRKADTKAFLFEVLDEWAEARSKSRTGGAGKGAPADPPVDQPKKRGFFEELFG